MAADIQQAPFALDLACDRIYHGAENVDGQFIGRYSLADPGWQRRLVIETRGSRSVVVWNPGSEGARKMADVPDDGWQDYFCIEASNAGPDVIALAPGAGRRTHAGANFKHRISCLRISSGRKQLWLR